MDPSLVDILWSRARKFHYIFFCDVLLEIIDGQPPYSLN